MDRITLIRVLFTLESIYHLRVQLIGVKTIFLNGNLDEEVCMEQSDGLVIPGLKNKVCRLVKSFYGLK